jgi:hypothetical protein
MMTDVDSAYRELIERTGLDPTLVREVEIRPLTGGRNGPGICLREGQSVVVPGYGRARFVREVPQALPQLALSPRLEVGAYLYVPLQPPNLAPAPKTADEYWQRVATLAAKAAPFEGRLRWSGGRENGWLAIIERALDAIIAVMEPNVAVDVGMREHFGNLDVDMRVMGGSAPVRKYLFDLAIWIEAAAVRRCAAFGTPGWRGPFGELNTFDWTLSDEARAHDEDEVRRLTYPRPPGTPTGGSDES